MRVLNHKGLHINVGGKINLTPIVQSLQSCSILLLKALICVTEGVRFSWDTKWLRANEREGVKERERER